MTDRIEIRVDGGPRQWAIVRDALERHDVRIEGETPMEHRSGTAATVAWIFVQIGIDRAVDAAVAELKERWPDLRIGVRRKQD